MIKKDVNLLNKINIGPIKSINCDRGQIVSKGPQGEALTIEDRDDLFHQHRSNRSAACNIPQLIRAPSLTAGIGHFHAISSLHQGCMLHQVDLTVSTVKSLTRLTWFTSNCKGISCHRLPRRKAPPRFPSKIPICRSKKESTIWWPG